LTVFGCSVVYADSGRSKIFLGCYPLKFGISKLIERFLPFDDNNNNNNDFCPLMTILKSKSHVPESY